MWGFPLGEVRRAGIDLVIAIGHSRSMLATDVKPNRLARAKLAVQDLVAELHGDRVALVAFAGSALLQCPLTLDYGAFAQSLDAVDVGIIPRGGTALTAAIDASLAAFEGAGEHQALVLITDGEDHEGASRKPPSARRARRQDLHRRHRHHRGRADPRRVGLREGPRRQVVKSRLDERRLKQVAVRHGRRLPARGRAVARLAELYRDYIDTLEKRAVASTLEKRFEHRFQLPLALAIVLLLLEPLLGERRAAGASACRGGRGAEVASLRRVLATLALAAVSSLARIASRRRGSGAGSTRGQIRGIGREVQRGAHRRAGFPRSSTSTSAPPRTSRASPPTR
jgi:Ca-activated chloride channel family protein